MSIDSISYATSSALSATHFKLVKSLEQSRSASDSLDIINQRLEKIRYRIATKLSSKSTKEDLILALYCREERGFSSESEDEVLLLAAVKLAGGGRTLSDRRLGYQACDAVFTQSPHPLKLLLVNTLRSDLYSVSSPRGDSTCASALRAITSPRIVSIELIPAIQDRIIELFSSSSFALRRLALAASLSLLGIADGEPNSHLLAATRSFVLSSLSSSRSSSSSHINRPASCPQLLAALVGATSLRSILHPLVDARSDIVLKDLMLILKRVNEGEWNEGEFKYHGVAVPWLCEKLLIRIGEEICSSETEEITQRKILEGLLLFVATILDRSDVAHGLFLASVQALSHIPPALLASTTPSQLIIIANLVGKVRLHLKSTNPNLQLLAVRCLVLLPSSIWMHETSGPSAWGEHEWKRIMSGLESHDGLIRKYSLRLVHSLDPVILESHRSRLLAALAQISTSIFNSPTTAATALVQQRDLFLSRLLEVTFSCDHGMERWIEQILEIVASTKSEGVLDVLVIGSIDGFASLDRGQQARFGSSLMAKEEWKGSVTLGLLVAATVGRGNTTDEERSLIIDDVSRWLAEYEVNPDLYEPFLLCLLRLVSQLSSIAEERLHSLYAVLGISTALLNSSKPILDQFAALANEEGIGILRTAGSHAKSSTLPGFSSVLHQQLYSQARLLHDVGVQPTDYSVSSPSRPLRYDAYTSSTSPNLLTGQSGLSGTESRRERKERGGGGGRMAESLMTAGALSLLVAEVEASDDGHDIDSEVESSANEAGEDSNHQPSAPPVLSSSRDLLIEVDPFLEG